jgi:hypothetical protein
MGGRAVPTSESPRAASATEGIGLPGTVLSWRAKYHKPAARQTRCDLCAPGHIHFPVWLALVILLSIVIAVIASNGH